MTRTNKTCAAGLLLAALLTIVPMQGVAAETTALASGAQGEPTRQGDVIRPFSRDRSYMGISASNKWLAQARIGGLMLNLRLFTPQGDYVPFQENLSAVEGDRKQICLTMRASHWDEELILQIDQAAMDVLARVNITQIVVADNQGAVRARYNVGELQQIRDYFGLKDVEQLCVSGEESPVTVVGEDGFRRQITR